MYGFPKSEHLCGQQRIAALYKTGRHFVVYPLRVTYRLTDGSERPKTAQAGTAEEARVKVLVWAPKALFKHAVDRNRMRRLMREAYRLEKLPITEWCEANDRHIEIAFNYMDKEKRSLEELRCAIRKAIGRVQGDKVQNDKGQCDKG